MTLSQRRLSATDQILLAVSIHGGFHAAVKAAALEVR